MPNVVQQKCACSDCVCIVEIKDAIEKDDRNFCSEECANGHPDGAAGCGHKGCGCRG
ncbi:MAG: metallothionein [Pseudomonadota bacterium]